MGAVSLLLRLFEGEHPEGEDGALGLFAQDDLAFHVESVGLRGDTLRSLRCTGGAGLSSLSFNGAAHFEGNAMNPMTRRLLRLLERGGNPVVILAAMSLPLVVRR